MKTVDQLISEVENIEDLELAADSLQLLKSSGPIQATRLAFLILENGSGDKYLQSFAFSILYSIDRMEAFGHIKNHLEDMDVHVFKSALESLAEDSPIINEIPGMRDIVKILKARIKSLGGADAKKYQYEIRWFKKTYEDI